MQSLNSACARFVFEITLPTAYPRMNAGGPIAKPPPPLSRFLEGPMGVQRLVVERANIAHLARSRLKPITNRLINRFLRQPHKIIIRVLPKMFVEVSALALSCKELFVDLP